MSRFISLSSTSRIFAIDLILSPYARIETHVKQNDAYPPDCLPPLTKALLEATELPIWTGLPTIKDSDSGGLTARAQQQLKSPGMPSSPLRPGVAHGPRLAGQCGRFPAHSCAGRW